jgi:hypothetical protein
LAQQRLAQAAVGKGIRHSLHTTGEHSHHTERATSAVSVTGTEAQAFALVPPTTISSWSQSQENLTAAIDHCDDSFSELAANFVRTLCNIDVEPTPLSQLRSNCIDDFDSDRRCDPPTRNSSLDDLARIVNPEGDGAINMDGIEFDGMGFIDFPQPDLIPASNVIQRNYDDDCKAGCDIRN